MASPYEASERQIAMLVDGKVYGYRQLNLMFRAHSNIFEMHQRGSLYRIRVRPGTSFWHSLRNQPVVTEPVVDKTVLIRQPTLFDCNLGDPTEELSVEPSANRAVHE